MILELRTSLLWSLERYDSMSGSARMGLFKVDNVRCVHHEYGIAMCILQATGPRSCQGGQYFTTNLETLSNYDCIETTSCQQNAFKNEKVGEKVLPICSWAKVRLSSQQISPSTATSRKMMMVNPTPLGHLKYHETSKKDAGVKNPLHTSATPKLFSVSTMYPCNPFPKL